jgi:hypothetical protein
LSETNVASRGVVRVCAEKCPTCIFRPGNPMDLRPRRVKEMLDYVRENDGVIPCHETLEDIEQAVCRGQFDAEKGPTLRLAEMMSVIEWT